MRSFLFRILLIFLLCTALATALGCSSQDEEAVDSSESSPPLIGSAVGSIDTEQTGVNSAAATVRGTLNLRLESFAIVLTPLKIAETESQSVASLLYSPLVSVDADGTVSGRLAQEWEQVDATTYRFTLHEGLTFTDGQPITVDTVIASLTAAMQPASPWAWALSPILHETNEDGAVVATGLEKVDELTLTMRLSQPTDWILAALDSPPGWVFPVGAEEGRYGVLPGSGPYVLGEIKPDSSIELVAREDGFPLSAPCDTVLFHYVPDGLAAAGKYVQGELDILSLHSPGLINELVDSEAAPPALQSQGELLIKPSQRIRIAIVNTKALEAKGMSPETAHDFVAALGGAVDRERIVAIGGGVLSEPLYTSFPPVAPKPAAAEEEQTPFETAEQYALEIITEADSYSDQLASIVADAPAPGVGFTYVSVEKGVLLQRLVQKDYDVAVIVLDGNIKSPVFWASFFTPGNPFTVFGTPLEGLGAVDLYTAEGVQRAGELIDANGNWVPLVREKRVAAVRPGVTGLRLTTSGQLRFERVAVSR